MLYFNCTEKFTLGHKFQVSHLIRLENIVHDRALGVGHKLMKNDEEAKEVGVKKQGSLRSSCML